MAPTLAVLGLFLLPEYTLKPLWHVKRIFGTAQVYVSSQGLD